MDFVRFRFPIAIVAKKGPNARKIGMFLGARAGDMPEHGSGSRCHFTKAGGVLAEMGDGIKKAEVLQVADPRSGIRVHRCLSLIDSIA